MSGYTMMIKDEASMRERMMLVGEMVKRGIQGGPVVVTARRPTRTSEQNAKYHAVIADIARHGLGGTHDADVVKAVVVDAFEEYMKLEGRTLTHPGQMAPSLDGNRVVSVRASTAAMTLSEMSELIEYALWVGTDAGVKWHQVEMRGFK